MSYHYCFYLLGLQDGLKMLQIHEIGFRGDIHIDRFSPDGLQGNSRIKSGVCHSCNQFSSFDSECPKTDFNGLRPIGNT